MPPHTQPPQPRTRDRTAPPPETIDPRWLLKAFGLMVGLAMICGYVTLCLLFYRGQWQLVLHPGQQPPGPPPAGAEIVRFGPDATATPQLTGWWLPAAADAPYRRLTLLYLRDADRQLSDDAAALEALHAAGLNVLAFNYCGFPANPSQRPSQQCMNSDAEAAWHYLLTVRHLAPGSIVPYGIGVGASLAVHLAGEHREVPALILDAPRGDLLADALRFPQAYLVPVRLLFYQRFPLAEPLRQLTIPKLIISRSATEAAASRQAADPKFTVELPPGSPPAALQPVLRRFLDQYLPAAALSESGPGDTRQTAFSGSD